VKAGCARPIAALFEAVFRRAGKSWPKTEFSGRKPSHMSCGSCHKLRVRVPGTNCVFRVPPLPPTAQTASCNPTCAGWRVPPPPPHANNPTCAGWRVAPPHHCHLTTITNRRADVSNYASTVADALGHALAHMPAVQGAPRSLQFTLQPAGVPVGVGSGVGSGAASSRWVRGLLGVGVREVDGASATCSAPTPPLRAHAAHLLATPPTYLEEPSPPPCSSSLSWCAIDA
jgi:hypothetical protein